MDADVLAVPVRRALMGYFLNEMRLSERTDDEGLSWFVRV